MRRAMADGVPAAAVAVVAVVCCAGPPALATLFGGVALGAVLGVAGGVVITAALLGAAMVALRVRRRRIGGS